jgi:adenine-specific DNA-methyltransferase
MRSLLDELPGIVKEGKRKAEQILERIEGNYRVGLQTRELVIPNKDMLQGSLYSGWQQGCKRTPKPFDLWR